jgi:multiple sugar transport system ATP-binding protein
MKSGGRSQKTWGLGDLGTWGLGDFGTWGLGDFGTWGLGEILLSLSPRHLVTSSPCHLVTLSPRHLVTLSPCHLVTPSPRHLVSRCSLLPISYFLFLISPNVKLILHRYLVNLMAQVSLQGITRQFGNVTAIADITFDIPDRAFWVLVGPSGCGKSTILRTIAGLESITKGELYIGDKLVNHLPARQRDVAMVFQNYALYPHMSVAENLAFGLKMRREEPKAIARRVQEVARSLDIEHLLKRKPKQLSGGQQQRVALGRAIARKPQVFLLDEPLSNLDAQLRDDTRAELKQLHQRVGITTIYVTHDQVEAMTLADQIVVLDEGKVQQIGSPQAIYANPINSMVAGFLGNPPMNIVPVTYDQRRFILFNNQTLQLNSTIIERLQPSQGQKFDLGIRPENIILVSGESESNDHTDSLILEVALVEPLGRETLVKATVPESNLALNLLTNAHWQGQRGDRLMVIFPLEHLFIFDPKSGKAI